MRPQEVVVNRMTASKIGMCSRGWPIVDILASYYTLSKDKVGKQYNAHPCRWEFAWTWNLNRRRGSESLGGKKVAADVPGLWSWGLGKHLQNSTSWISPWTYLLPNPQSPVSPVQEEHSPNWARWPVYHRRLSAAWVIYWAQSWAFPGHANRNRRPQSTATSWSWKPCWDGIRDSRKSRFWWR